MVAVRPPFPAHFSIHALLRLGPQGDANEGQVDQCFLA